MMAMMAIIWVGMGESLMAMAGCCSWLLVWSSVIGGQKRKRQLSQKVVFVIRGLSSWQKDLQNSNVDSIANRMYYE